MRVTVAEATNNGSKQSVGADLRVCPPGSAAGNEGRHGDLPLRHLIIGAGAVALILVAIASPVIAARVPAGGTAIPAAADCTVQARAFEEIADLSNAPVSPPEAVADDATPADEATVAAITDTIRLAMACANANDPLRSLSLFTDRYVSERFGPDHPDDLGSLNAALSRTPTPAEDEDLLALVEVRDVLVSAGRAGSVVVTENRSARFVDRLTLEQVDDRWLIDSWAPIGEMATPTA